MEKSTKYPCGRHPRWNISLEKISKKVLQVEDVAFWQQLRPGTLHGLWARSELRVQFNKVKQILGSMDRSTESKCKVRGMPSSAWSGHLSAEICLLGTETNQGSGRGGLTTQGRRNGNFSGVQQEEQHLLRLKRGLEEAVLVFWGCHNKVPQMGSWNNRHLLP